MSAVVFKELTQKMVEDYEAELPTRDSRAAVSNGAAVRAAIKAGWFAEPPCPLDGIGSLKPSRVNYLARAVVNEYKRVMVFDPE